MTAPFDELREQLPGIEYLRNMLTTFIAMAERNGEERSEFDGRIAVSIPCESSASWSINIIVQALQLPDLPAHACALDGASDPDVFLSCRGSRLTVSSDSLSDCIEMTREFVMRVMASRGVRPTDPS